MFEGKNKHKNKVLAHVMSYALVFALFNRSMMLSEYDARARIQVQPQAQVYINAQITETALAQTAEELHEAVDDDYIEIIELIEDIELEQTLIIPEEADITINGNGHYISSPFADAPAIEISPGAALSLEDVTIAGESAADWGSGGILVSHGGLLTMGEGSLVQGFAGSGIIVSGGSFVLDGGTVAYNSDAGSFGIGGGIRLNGGEFVMYGGEVRGNGARTAGGIFVSGPANIELHGGAIHGNSAEAGGGLFLGPPNPNVPFDQTIVLKIGEGAENMIFDNSCDTDIRWIEGGPGIQGIVINDLEDFLENQAQADDPDSNGNLVLLFYDDDEDEPPEAPEAPPAEGEDIDAENGGDEENDEGAEPREEPENEPQETEPQDDSEGEPEGDESEGDEPQETEPADELEDEPQSSFPNLMVTNPQTGDEFSFLGLVMAAVGFVMSVFLLLAYREREKLERTRNARPYE
jgi:hypothetical protein